MEIPTFKSRDEGEDDIHIDREGYHIHLESVTKETKSHSPVPNQT